MLRDNVNGYASLYVLFFFVALHAYVTRYVICLRDVVALRLCGFDVHFLVGDAAHGFHVFFV